MLKTPDNPGGVPIEVFDEMRAAAIADRSQQYKDHADALMALDLRGQADGRAGVDRLRERSYLLGGTPPEQRPHDDARGVVSLTA
jgi:non-heme chloroperoxidase